MNPEVAVIASGNLATASRAVTGVLGQFVLLKVDDDKALDIFTNVGLPARALQEPDFPISLDQELAICLALSRGLKGRQSPVCALLNARDLMGIENLGVLGMAMRHAATAVESLKVCLRFPQLAGGHSRMIVRRAEQASQFVFSMQRPVLRDASDGEIDALIEYCLTLDLVTSLRNIEDVAATGEPPLYITFPFARPDDWEALERPLPCPVQFDAQEACLAYPAALDDSPLPRANPLAYKSYVSIAEKMSLMLAEDVSVQERVMRWLWAYTPPLKRGEIAQLLAMSERNLTRQLGIEGTSYAQLLARVQEERAKNFLRNRALTVGEIGYRLGYTEPAAFTRAFTRWVGISPLKWRKRQL
jgi:AraC-like DNA-binding protein